MIVSPDIAAWLTANVPLAGAPTFISVEQQQTLPQTPDFVCFITMIPAPGGSETDQRAYDNIAFQVRVRGPQNAAVNPTADAPVWIAAQAVDHLLLDQQYPRGISGVMGDHWWIGGDRISSPPSSLIRDSANRLNVACNYVLCVTRLPIPS